MLPVLSALSCTCMVFCGLGEERRLTRSLPAWPSDRIARTATASATASAPPADCASHSPIPSPSTWCPRTRAPCCVGHGIRQLIGFVSGFLLAHCGWFFNTNLRLVVFQALPDRGPAARCGGRRGAARSIASCFGGGGGGCARCSDLTGVRPIVIGIGEREHRSSGAHRRALAVLPVPRPEQCCINIGNA